MRTAADLRDLATRNGLRVEQTETITSSDGRPVMVSRLSFTDPWDAARFLCDAAEEDAGDPVVREWALAIMAACRHELGETGPTSRRRPSKPLERPWRSARATATITHGW